jgi:DNA-binding transcriptional LysR family regulator
MNIPVLDPDLLKAFVAVADNRSFTRAASMLNRTQSAVSMQIKRLEDRLGVELFHRTKVNVELSSAGEGLLGYARRILVLNDEAVGRVWDHKVEGSVRIGVMDDYGTFLVPPLLSSFVGSYPLIHVEMETGLTASMPGRLGEAFDLVIAMHPEGRGEGEFLRREQAVWAAAATHSVEKLNPLPVALAPQGCLFRKWAIDALDAMKRPWRLAFVSHSTAAVEAVTAQGLAVTVVKAGTFPSNLRQLTESDDMPALPAADICLHRASNLSPAAMLLADHLATAMSRHPEGRRATGLPGSSSLSPRHRLGTSLG